MKRSLLCVCSMLLLIPLLGCWWYVTPEAQRRFQARPQKPTITVYPVHVALRGKVTQGDFRLGREVVSWLNAQQLAEASFGHPGVPIAVQWHRNQAKMAEESAKAFGTWVQQAQIATDYALLVEILCNGEETKVLGVHFYLAEKSGLLADGSLTNSHWEEFKRINPVDRYGGLSVFKEMLQKRWQGPSRP